MALNGLLFLSFSVLEKNGLWKGKTLKVITTRQPILSYYCFYPLNICRLRREDLVVCWDITSSDISGNVWFRSFQMLGHVIQEHGHIKRLF